MMGRKDCSCDTFTPLISILVVTYNSAEFVLETLESTKKQTYKNIELIITDDGSKDETVSICESWLLQNKDRFVRTQLITVPQNTGIPANCNRGVKASNGEWIKIIAGDDILLDSCIEHNVCFMGEKGDGICVSKMKVFNQDGELKKQTENYNRATIIFTNKNQYQQKKAYLRVPIMLNIPALFISKNVITRVHGFDEEIRLLEDQPFLIKCLLYGYKIDFCDEYTVKYRKHSNGVMQINADFVKALRLSFNKYIVPELRNNNAKDVFFRVYHQVAFVVKESRFRNNFFARLYLRAINLLVRYS